MFTFNFITRYERQIMPFSSEAGSLLYLGPIDLAHYYVMVSVLEYVAAILKPSLQDHNIDKAGRDKMISVRFSFGRRLLSPCLTIYVPTLLLNIIALTTNYFKVTINVI